MKVFAFLISYSGVMLFLLCTSLTSSVHVQADQLMLKGSFLSICAGTIAGMAKLLNTHFEREAGSYAYGAFAALSTFVIANTLVFGSALQIVLFLVLNAISYFLVSLISKKMIKYHEEQKQRIPT